MRKTGRIPVLIDNTQSPPFPVMETSAELLYLLKEFDKQDAFGFKDEFERNQCLQWLFFWHGSVCVSPPPFLNHFFPPLKKSVLGLIPIFGKRTDHL